MSILPPLRRYNLPEISGLSYLMRELIESPSMGIPLADVSPQLPADHEGQECESWLRNRGRELPWIDRCIAPYPDARPIGYACSRRAAIRLARELDALTIRSADYATGRVDVARGLLKHIDGVVTALEALVEASGDGS